MQITGINFVNSISMRNQKRNNKLENSYLTINNKGMNKDQVSFGMTPLVSTLAQEAIQRSAGKLFTIAKNKYAMNEAIKFFNQGHIIPGLEVAIEVNNRLQSKGLSKIFVNIFDFLDTAAKHAEKLPDDKFAHRDIKQKFLEAIFLAETKDHPNSLIFSYNNDVIPSGVKTMFKNLNVDLYGEFRANLIEKAVLEKEIMLNSPEELMMDIKDESIRQKILSKIAELKDESGSSFYNNDGSSFFGNYSG